MSNSAGKGGVELVARHAVDKGQQVEEAVVRQRNLHSTGLQQLAIILTRSFQAAVLILYSLIEIFDKAGSLACAAETMS